MLLTTESDLNGLILYGQADCGMSITKRRRLEQVMLNRKPIGTDLQPSTLLIPSKATCFTRQESSRAAAAALTEAFLRDLGHWAATWLSLGRIMILRAFARHPPTGFLTMA